MSAFTKGDYVLADQLFARFEQEHPKDARIEDALFLRRVATSMHALSRLYCRSRRPTERPEAER